MREIEYAPMEEDGLDLRVLYAIFYLDKFLLAEKTLLFLPPL
jgi:hypothetical protein